MPDTGTAPSWTRTRARIANHGRQHPGEEPPADMRRDHAAARLEDYIRRTVAAAPPLTTEQRDRLATLLHPQPIASDGGGAT